MWRFTSVSDLLTIFRASVASTLFVVSGFLLLNRFEGFSRSVFIIDWCLTFIFVAGVRLLVRIYFENNVNDNFWWINFYRYKSVLYRKKRPNQKNLLIIGAGGAGEKIYREIRDNAALRYNVVGFLDDASSKQGKLIHGVPVLGKVADVNAIVDKTDAEEILIAIASASALEMRHIFNACESIKIPCKTIPGIGELINGKVTINSIRDVSYSDLLGREDVKLNENEIGSYIDSAPVIVTGAGGSIGSELSRQICRFQPKELILLERTESSLYAIEMELKRQFPFLNIVPVLADIQYPNQLKYVFEKYNPEIVFHAAAYKHVPMMELHAWKAVKNNIIGTQNLVEVSRKFSVKRFVLVSTDKAVRPTNVMGTTKRVAEMMVLNQMYERDCKTKFMAVRFGNVVGSAGSVLPLFKKQIEEGGPITVTHKDITRYFMTIPEAAQLILQAGAMGAGGEIFILDMGEPVRIDALARDFIRLSGFEPDVDIEIKYIGLRPGEKLYEELITEGEGIVPTEHRKIMVLKGQEKDLVKLNGNIELLKRLAEDQSSYDIRAKLKEIVPEYNPASH
jgi:FlaA1/EpsC-like NDP-sugar epimerase